VDDRVPYCSGCGWQELLFVYIFPYVRPVAVRVFFLQIRTCNYDVEGLQDHTRLIPRVYRDRRSLYSFVKGNLKMHLETLHFNP
jgi:hypothetical protein